MLHQDQAKPISQLSEWKGSFGDSYIGRNEFEDWKMTPGTEAFRRMLVKAKVESILEVGSNIGLNLIFLNNLFNGDIKLNAVEPNRTAYGKLTSRPGLCLENSWNCDGFNIPLPDESVDLVFTNGVLIHIHPDNLGRLTDEIMRVSRKYVLCSEYFSHEPEERPYHGKKGLLFKRDFGAFYLDRYADLTCIDYGFLWMNEFQIFDNLNWWLFQKAE